jgi:uncharacterized protein (TIGR02266 family)
MTLYCPFCSEEITPETIKCPSCERVYNSDTLSFIDLSARTQDELPDERRRQTRFTTKFKVAYYTAEDFMDHYIFNLSLGGLFVETNKPLAPGEKLDLKIFLLDKTEPMEIPCEVKWNRKTEETDRRGKRLPSGMGVKFSKLSEENLKRLIDVLNRSLNYDATSSPALPRGSR